MSCSRLEIIFYVPTSREAVGEEDANNLIVVCYFALVRFANASTFYFV